MSTQRVLLLGFAGAVTLVVIVWTNFKRHRPPRELSQQQMNDFLTSPGGQITRDSIEFLTGILDAGELPGVPAGEHGSMVPDNMRTNAESYPVTRTVHFTSNRDASSHYHYTVTQADASKDWRLQRAWHTDANGKILEEYSLRETNPPK